jgi:hypothetical protein
MDKLCLICFLLSHLSIQQCVARAKPHHIFILGNRPLAHDTIHVHTLYSDPQNTKPRDCDNIILRERKP